MLLLWNFRINRCEFVNLFSFSLAVSFIKIFSDIFIISQVIGVQMIIFLGLQL